MNHESLSPDAEDLGSNDSIAPHFSEVAAARLSRRGFLQGAAMLASGAMGGSLAGCATMLVDRPSLGFAEIAPGPKPDHAVAPGYRAQVLIRWGDRVLAGAPDFDVRQQSAYAQLRQFGYNCDFLAYAPLPAGSQASDHGLLWVNHEYTTLHMMFPGLDPKTMAQTATKEMADIELAAHGGSIVEVRKRGGRWEVVEGSRYARRITPLTTEMAIAGPAAGHARMKTKADPTGTRVLGMINNCAGGWTPWGTVLSGEENFNLYFGGDFTKTPEARNYRRYGFRAQSRYAFPRFHDRFHVEREPNEGNRFGWVVEIDPYDPHSMPVKRTALGRFKHEGATVWVNPNGTVTVYSGDDEANDYVYKFVSRGRYDPQDRAANRTLLDDGTLYVAQFGDDGIVRWLPLVFGEGPLTPQNDFHSQADVLIETRRAADLLRATPMDRPEDVETNPVTGRTYVALTNNRGRKAGEVNRANPRAANDYGHIVELIPPGEGKYTDHAALEHRWEMFLLAGPLEKGGKYGPGTTSAGATACPDGFAFDSRGRMWIATDQGTLQGKFGIGDGLWATETAGAMRAVTKFFYRVPTGAEMCGPCFTPDDRTLFVAIQHPATDDPGSTYERPTTRWPDFRDDMPPRPSVVVITKDDGGEIGG